MWKLATSHASLLSPQEIRSHLLGCRPMKNTLSGTEGRGFMKILVASDTDTVVGVHLIGPETAEIIQVGSRRHASDDVLAWRQSVPGKDFIP